MTHAVIVIVFVLVIAVTQLITVGIAINKQQTTKQQTTKQQATGKEVSGKIAFREKTKIAFNNEKIKNNIIENSYYNFSDNIFQYYNIVKKTTTQINYHFDIATSGNKTLYDKYIINILSQESINNFIEYKFYKDTDIEILKSNYIKINSFYLFLFDDTLDGDNKTIWKCKY